MGGRSATRGKRRGLVHEPTLATILMIERAIHKADDYPTKAALWRALPRKVQYQTFSRVIDYLLSSNKIILNDHEIVWIFPDNPKLKTFLDSNVRVRRKR
jgi:hypothetical protein